MANRYWVTGGDGNWNSTTNWSTSSGGASGASVPGSSDAALLDANSGSGTVTLDISPTIQTLTCTGFTGTLAFGTNTISLNSTGTIFTGATTMTVTGTPQIICTNNSATSRTLSSGGAVTEANSISIRITAGTGTVALGTSSYRDLDFTDGVNPTGYAGALSSSTVTVFGNFRASTGMTQTAGTGSLIFAATSGTKTIDTAGVTFDRPFTFNGIGGTFQLQAALTSGATRTCTLTNGTLNLAGYTLTTGIFNSNNGNVRTLAFGVGNITVTGNATTVWSCSNLTNFSYTGTPTVNFTYSGSTGTRTINNGVTGATETNVVDFNVTAGSDQWTATAVNSVRNLNFTGFSGVTGLFGAGFIYGNLILSATQTVTASSNATTFAATSGVKTITTNNVLIDRPLTFNGIGGTWACQDALTLGSTKTLTMTNGTLQLKAGATSTVGGFATSGTNQKYLQSTLAGTQATLSQASGTVDVSYLTIQDSNATGGAAFNAYSNQSNIDAGNNDGWDFGLSPVVGGVEYTYQLRSFVQPRRF
jgi:hypothetical protein